MNSVTTVSSRRQTVIPAHIGVKPGTKLRWLKGSDKNSLLVQILPDDPLQSLEGLYKGENLVKKLLSTRKNDARKEESRR